MARFRKNFEKNVDYLVKIKNIFKVKDSKIVEYFITLDTFERICMMTKSKVGNSTRTYFLTLRKFIQYYKNNIYNMIINSNCVIYIILINKKKNIYKIGQSCNLRNRLKVYNTSMDIHPDIKYVIQVDNPRQVENCAKIIMQNYNFQTGKELYKINIDLIKSTIFNCSNSTKVINNSDLNDLNAYILFEESEKSSKNNTKSNTIKNKSSTKKHIKKDSAIKNNKKSNSRKKNSVKKISYKKK